MPGQVCPLTGMWAKATGSFGQLDGNANTPGFDTRGGGFLAGADRQVGSNLTIGFATGYSYTSLDQTDSESGTISTPRLLAYGRYSWGPWAIGATLGYAYDAIKSQRPIPGMGKTASASYNANELTDAVGLGRQIKVKGITLEPTIGVNYAHYAQGAFTETGAPGFNLSVAAMSAISVRPYIGLSATGSFTRASGLRLTPEADIRFSHEMKDTPLSLVEVGGGRFSVAGLEPSRNEVSLGAGIAAQVNPRMNFHARFEAVLPTGNRLQESLDAGLTYRF